VGRLQYASVIYVYTTVLLTRQSLLIDTQLYILLYIYETVYRTGTGDDTDRVILIPLLLLLVNVYIMIIIVIVAFTLEWRHGVFSRYAGAHNIGIGKENKTNSDNRVSYVGR